MSEFITFTVKSLDEQIDDLTIVIQTLSAERDSLTVARAHLTMSDGPVDTAPFEEVHPQDNRNVGRVTSIAKYSSKRERIESMLNDGDSVAVIVNKLQCSQQYIYNVRRQMAA